MLDGAWFGRLGQDGFLKVRSKIWQAMVGWPLSPAGTRPHSMFLLGLRNAATDRAGLVVAEAVGVGCGALVGELLGAVLGIWIGLPPTLGSGPPVGALTTGVGTGIDGAGAEEATGGAVVPPTVQPAAMVKVASVPAVARSSRTALIRRKGDDPLEPPQGVEV
jgi:hypothetical protein